MTGHPPTISLAGALFAAASILTWGVPISYGLVWLSTSRIHSTAPFGVSPEAWAVATKTPSDFSGILIGLLERTIFLMALVANVPELIVGWLAFKVASKWEAWHNVVQAPSSLEGLDPIEQLRARHIWGSTVLTRVVVGTAANLLLAALAYALVLAFPTQ